MRLRGERRDLVPLLFAIVVLAMFWRPLTVETFYFRDLYRLFYPKKLFLAEAIRDGFLPLWDPLTAGGRPYLAVPSNYALHPSNIFYLFLPTIFVFNFVLVAHVFFCAAAAYWLARSMRLSVPAAAIAGSVFGFCGYTLSAANLTLILLGLPWVPLAIGFTRRAILEGRSIAPAAIAAAMPLYSGAAELTAMLFVTLVVLECGPRLTAWLRRRESAERRELAIAARKVFLIIAFACGLSLAQTLPASSVIAQSARAVNRSYDAFTQWSVAPQRLPELIVPRYFGDTDSLREEAYWGRAYETGGFPYILSLYIGLPALILAGFGARRAPWLAFLAVLGIVLSLGRHLPGFSLLYELPFVATFRYPVKAQMLSLVPIALLAALGAEVLEKRRWALALAAIAAALAFVHPGFIHTAIAAAAFALAPRGPILAAIVCADLVIAGYRVNDYAPRSIFDEPPIARPVREVVGEGRFYAAERPVVLSAPDDDLMWLARWQIATLDSYNAAMFGIPVVYHRDFDGLSPLRVAQLGAIIEKLPWSRRGFLLERAAVRGFMAPEVVPGHQEVARLQTGGGALRLYANPGAPRARFVSDAELARTPEDALRRATMSDRAIIEQPAEMGRCGSAPVRRISASTYIVDAPCRGLVVFAEPHYDGWTAAVDGRIVPHIRADYAFTAVPVGNGRHTITRRYRQPLLVAGLLGTAVSAALLFVVARPRRPSESTNV